MKIPKHSKFTCQICSTKTVVKYKGLYDDRYGAKGKHNIYICQKCGFGKTTPGISKKEIGKFYKKHYPLSRVDINKLTKQPTIPSKLITWLKGLNHTTHYQAKKGQKVLDIGCGSCRSLVEIKSLGVKAYGVEPDPTAQKIAKKLKLKVHQGFIQDDPFPKTKFDLVTASQVLEHDPNPSQFIKACTKKLAKKGQIILSFPNLNALSRYIFQKKWIHWHVPYHLNFFTKKSIQILAQKNNLKIKKLTTVTPNLWTVLQLQSLLLGTPKEGTQNPLWPQAVSLKKKPVTEKSKLINLLRSATKIAESAVSIPNRIIDTFLLGDSWLVTLEKHEK